MEFFLWFVNIPHTTEESEVREKEELMIVTRVIPDPEWVLLSFSALMLPSLKL